MLPQIKRLGTVAFPYILILFLAFASLSWNNALAQSDVLFAPLLQNRLSDATPEQSTYLRRLQEQPITTSLQLVRVNLAALNGDVVSIPLTDAASVQAKRRKTVVRSPSDFTWFGDLSPTGGQAILVIRNGDVTGSIRTGLDLYRVTPLGDGVHALIKLDQSRFPPDHSSPPPRAPNRGDATPTTAPTPPAAVAADGVQVDVLVAYTTSAATASGNIGALIQLAIDESNQAYTNSNANVEYRLVGTMEVTGYSEAGKTFQQVLCDITNQNINFGTGTCTVTNDAPMAAVRARRDQAGADLVQVLINNNTSCGLAWINSAATTAFSVTHYDCATGNYTFSHEIGHNFGALHDTDPSTTPFAYGHGFNNCNTFRTIMAVTVAGCTRIQYFSNPLVTFNGVATGTAATNDVARVHRERVATVAGFRAAVIPPSLAVSPATNIAASGPQGGPFSPSSFQYQLSATTNSVNYSISGVPSWLTPSSTSGTVGTTATTVTFTVNANANALAAGTYGPTTITFTNTTNAQGNTTRTATLTVNVVNRTLTVSASPPAGGTVSGGGTFPSGSSRTVTATANSGYSFVNWTESGTQVSTSASYTFTLNSNRTLVANFVFQPPSCTLTANPLIVTRGLNTTLSWTSNNATSGTLDNGLGNLAPVSAGSRAVSPIQTTTYRATFSGPGGTVTCQTTVVVNLRAACGGSASQVGDFNGDLRCDLVLRHTNGTLAMYLWDGFRLLDAQAVGQLGPEWQLAGTGDFNGDGKSDMLFRRADGTLSLFLWDGFRLLAAQVIGQIGPDWSLAGVSDFNGDGKADTIFRHRNGAIAIYLWNGFNLLAAQQVGQIGPEWELVAVGDFNGDGKADTLFRKSDGTLALYLWNGFNLVAAQIIGKIGPEWSQLAVGDFNGDGKSDILFRRNDGALAFYLWDGFNLIAAQVVGQIGPEWARLSVGDFNGDSKSDTLLRRTDGALAIYLWDGFRLTAAQVIGQIGPEWN